MPDMREADGMKVLAILCADLHLSQRPPIARVDDNWFEAMARPLREVRSLVAEHKCPVLCAGDLFHIWNSSPELIAFALRELPRPLICVAGNHDLPQHSYEDRRRSAYGVLEEAGAIINLGPGEVWRNEDLAVWGFPCDTTINPPPPVSRETEGLIWTALIHAYIWTKGHNYPNAPADKRLGTYRAALQGYSFAVTGDNHIPFEAFSSPNGGCYVFNCGSLMRRNIDQIDYKPSVGLLIEDGSIMGTIKRHYLDVSRDVLAPKIAGRTEEQITGQLDMAAFVDELGGLDATRLDFPAAVRRAAEGLTPRAKAVLLTALGV